MQDIAYNIYNLIIHDFFFIPTKLKQENRFCLWKYEQSGNSIKKPLKRPYGLDSINRIIPSLKNKDYWFSLQKLEKLNNQVKQEYGLGLVLNDGPYTVIDLDDCIIMKDSKYILIKGTQAIIDLFPDAYFEISPSNTGLHIIVQGQWLANCNKAKRYISRNLKKGTLEIYSGYDCRYITLTGNTINKSLMEELPYYSWEGKSLQKLYEDFFSTKGSNNIFKTIIRDPLINKNHFNSNIILLAEKYSLIRKKILDSSLSVTYSAFYKFDNPGYKYKSISEADWSYFCLINRFLKSNQAYDEKYSLLRYFYYQDRPGRYKKNREDYIKITIEKVLNISLSQKNTERETTYEIQDLKRISRYEVLKMCNTMKIFHLGRSVQNFEYINDKKDNYLKAIIPISLNQNDLIYYIEILDQYANLIVNDKYLCDQYVQININKVLQNVNKTKSGRSHNQFIQTIKKLSAVNLEYHKKISKDGSLYSQEGGSLLYYKYTYNKSETQSKRTYKRLAVKMHTAVFDILKLSNYNYTIFNKKSYRLLTCNKMKLLYYYFSLSTLPASFSQNFSVSELIDLWPNTQNQKTLWARKNQMSFLLQEFVNKSKEMIDLDAHLLKNGTELMGIRVKKRKLILD